MCIDVYIAACDIVCAHQALDAVDMIVMKVAVDHGANGFVRDLAKFPQHFAALGFTKLHNVQGGIDAWSQQIDPSVPRY